MGNKQGKGGAAPAAAAAAQDESSDTFIPASGYSRAGDQKKVSIDDFDLLKVIGKGSFGKVMQVKKKDSGDIYAMKVLRKDAILARNQIEHTKAERSILEAIRHPFIVNLHYAFQTQEKLYLVIDYVNGGELFFHLRRSSKFPMDRAQLYAAEILLAIEHLHKSDIIYRDLKPENILLGSDGHVRLTDFGLSRMEVKTEGEAKTFCGTPEYLAPEILNGQGHGKAVDWWTLGTLLFEMIFGLPPFYSQNLNTMYEKILRAPLRFPDHTPVSDDTKNLLTGLLNRSPKDRLGANGAAEIKAHPFWKNVDWQALWEKKVNPSFKPEVTSDTDYKYVDPAFTREPVVDSVVDQSKLDPSKTQFENFTYVAPNTMGGGDDGAPLGGIGEE